MRPRRCAACWRERRERETLRLQRRRGGCVAGMAGRGAERARSPSSVRCSMARQCCQPRACASNVFFTRADLGPSEELAASTRRPPEFGSKGSPDLIANWLTDSKMPGRLLTQGSWREGSEGGFSRAQGGWALRLGCLGPEPAGRCPALPRRTAPTVACPCAAAQPASRPTQPRAQHSQASQA